MTIGVDVMVMLLSSSTELLSESLVFLSKFSNFVRLLYNAVVTAIDYSELAITRSAASAACGTWSGAIALFISVSNDTSPSALSKEVRAYLDFSFSTGCTG